MAEPFLAEIRLVSFNFAPRGWALCNGQTLPINQNQALFSLLGTTYGGNGQTTFALPDLRGRIPIHFGSGHIIGERAGSEAVTITSQTMPSHTHVLNSTTADATTDSPSSSDTIASAGMNLYGPSTGALVSMHASPVGNVGGSQPHTNMAPYLVLNFCIALQGIFPTQN